MKKMGKRKGRSVEMTTDSPPDQHHPQADLMEEEKRITKLSELLMRKLSRVADWDELPNETLVNWMGGKKERTITNMKKIPFEQ